MDHMGRLYRKRTKEQIRQVTPGRDRMEEITFRLAIMDPFLERYNWYAPLLEISYRLDRFILTPVIQAGQSKPEEYVTISILTQAQTITGRSSTEPVACFCSLAKSC